ncbi:MAG: TlpA family protein disulfide reductase [Candidatus Marinimicrobia bacterium]|nr:TlpA family protein disulfide reductase [Candidatus Neomarinimicrobiota bacterium]
MERFYQFPLLLLLFSLIGFSGGCSPTVEIHQTDADFILKTVSTHTGSEGVLVNFWATWCEPCVEEFPMIVELSREYASQGLAVYFVSVDWLDEQAQVSTFLKEHGVTGLSFIKDQDSNEFIDAISKQWTGAIPFTIVFGKSSGNVVDLWEGKESKERFESAIKKALSESMGGS